MSSKRDLIFHPVRLRVLRTLGHHHYTPQHLQALMPDIPQATLYRHLKTLEKGGVLEVVSTQKKRGTLEKTYGLKQADMSPEELQQATSDDWQHMFQQFCTFLMMDFERYLADENATPLQDGVGFRQVLLHLSPDELQKMAQEINAILTPFLKHKPTKERKKMVFSTILMPEIDPIRD